MTDAAAIRLKKRHAAETRFRMYGRVAIIVALSFLVLLLGRIGMQGYSTFTTHTLSLPVYLDPARIDRSYLEGSNYDTLVAQSLLKQLGETDDEFNTVSDDAMGLVSRDLGFQILDKIKADPTLIGKTISVTGPVKADADLYYKGELKRSTDQADRKLNDRQLAWLDRLKKSGAVTGGFNVGFFTHADSTEPEQAGILGAIIGSAMMLLVTALIAVPMGVLAAVWLEEFAPKNRWTDDHRGQHQQPRRGAVDRLRPARPGGVPQLVRHATRGAAGRRDGAGADGAADIIIATRAALKAVPPSIREAALGVGASRSRPFSTTSCRRPCPGMMTGTILGMAHALGETAPLLMIGMIAFIVDFPKASPVPPACCRCSLHLGRRLRTRLPEQDRRSHHGAAGLPDRDERGRGDPAPPLRARW
jgi:phosphate transport system permease protein